MHKCALSGWHECVTEKSSEWKTQLNKETESNEVKESHFDEVVFFFFGFFFKLIY